MKKIDDKIKQGVVNTLKVNRVSEPGIYLISGDETEVLLPNAYVKKEMAIDSLLDVFIYTDSEDRLVATTLKPYLYLNEFANLKIVDSAKFGYFVDIGLPKDLLVPKNRQKGTYNIGSYKVLQMIGERRIMMRSSRGIAPRSFRVDSKEERKILAIGAHQKNAIAIYLNHQVILSPYIGDLDTIASFELFRQTMDVFKAFYDFEPDLIVGDLHPNYASTGWAKEQNKPFIQVQHHYAHILSAMFEHHLDEKVLGIAWDGTGYGDDGTIWGGEFLVCDTHSYERVAYFEPFSLLGGDASIKDIRRILLSILFDLGKDGVEITSFEAKELKFLKQVHEKKLNSPFCSSVGRLFDAVAVLCGMNEKVSYDGESGLLIEGLYDETLDEAYPIFLDGKIIRYKHIFEMMLKDIEPRIIATKFINALANIACEISKHYELKTVLCGGVFQNRILMENIVKKTSGPLYFPQDIPINDGGICVGQLYKILSK